MTCYGGMFSLVSVWMASAREDNLQVELVGYYGGSQTARAILTLSSTDDPTFLDSELSYFAYIDNLLIISIDRLSQVIFDNMKIKITSPCSGIPKEGPTSAAAGDSAAKP